MEEFISWSGMWQCWAVSKAINSNPNHIATYVLMSGLLSSWKPKWNAKTIH